MSRWVAGFRRARLRSTLLAFILLPAALSANVAAEPDGPVADGPVADGPVADGTQSDGLEIEFEIGAGGAISPLYEGSSRYAVSPYPAIRFGYLRLPNGYKLGGGDGLGLSIVPSFRYLSG